MVIDLVFTFIIIIIMLMIGAPDYLINVLQVQQLNAARTVCGYQSYYWSTTKLLNTCGWLSIKQQMFASTVSMAHNIVKSGVPRNIYSTLVTQYPYRTRQATIIIFQLKHLNIKRE